MSISAVSSLGFKGGGQTHLFFQILHWHFFFFLPFFNKDVFTSGLAGDFLGILGGDGCDGSEPACGGSSVTVACCWGRVFFFLGLPLGFLSADDLLAGALDPWTGSVSSTEQVHFFFLHFFLHFLFAAFRDFFTAFGFRGALEGGTTGGCWVDSDAADNCVWRQSCLTVETVGVGWVCDWGRVIFLLRPGDLDGGLEPVTTSIASSDSSSDE